MKKISTLLLLCSIAVTSNAQFGKFLKKGEGEKEEGLPKGIEVYTTEHKDAKGISGKYYTKYPVTLASLNMMNMPKPFKISEVTVELRDNLTGVFHFVNDEPKNQIRYKSTDMTTTYDFGSGAMNPEVAKKTMEKCNCSRFMVKNTFMPKSGVGQGFKDGALVIVYSKDPDIILIGSPNISDYEKKGTKGYFVERGMDFLGGQLNVLSKDKAKLEQWDSTKIADALFSEYKIFETQVSSAFGDMVAMPKQFTNDDAREKEYFDMIKPMASEDKPVAWGDRMEYVYISQDWNVVYKDLAKKIPSHRFLHVIAVSSGWKNNECRYIPCVIKQNWEGTAYGKSYFAGFKGALVPVNCETTKKFKH